MAGSPTSPSAPAAPGGFFVPRRTLVVFGRLPEAGLSKTRLVPALGDEGAAELYRAFLDDTIASATAIAPTELWVPPRPGARERLARRYGVTVREQRGRDLGGRLADAFERSFAGGSDYVAVLGSDHPTLPAEYIERLFRALVGAHLAVGPTHDGGYYAIALRRYCWPRARGLFAGAPWSTDRLLEWTRARAESLDLCHVELPLWYDVDEPADLERLREDAKPDSRTARALASLAERGARASET